MDKLNLLHPSLGLAFTAEFAPRKDVIISANPEFIAAYRAHVVQSNAATDGLPVGCPGCRERLDGSLDCCQEVEE